MNKMVLQIIVVSVATLLTLGVSIYSLIESGSKERELKLKQDSLIDAQNALLSKQEMMNNQQATYAARVQQKSDEIIQLQQKLQGQSDQQLDELNRLRNPIPSTVKIGLSAELNLLTTEYNQILSIHKERYLTSQTNLLPFNFSSTNLGFDKINHLRDVGLHLLITLEKNGKTLSFKFEQQPLVFLGYNTVEFKNSMKMFLEESSKKVLLEASELPTADIRVNHSTPSMLDYRGAKARITYELFYPRPTQIGNQSAKLYVADKREYVTINIKSLDIQLPTFLLSIENIHKIDSHTFDGVCSGI